MSLVDGTRDGRDKQGATDVPAPLLSGWCMKTVLSSPRFHVRPSEPASLFLQLGMRIVLYALNAQLRDESWVFGSPSRLRAAQQHGEGFVTPYAQGRVVLGSSH